MTLRIVTITKENGYTLEADEQILEKRTSYGEVVTWELLIAKGSHEGSGSSLGLGPTPGSYSAREEARDAAYAKSEAQMKRAFAASFAAFAAVLGET